jgi:hypothetical protein
MRQQRSRPAGNGAAKESRSGDYIKGNSNRHPAASTAGAALELAEAGWSVLPCREAGLHPKSPYTKHGFYDASTEPDTIRDWWARWPSALIGAKVPPSLVALDIDPRNGGSYEILVNTLGLLPETLTVWSGRGDGGRHLYFRRPAGRLTSRNLPRGVDLKANGYCIMPPSLHPDSSQPYRWDGFEPMELPPTAAVMLTQAAPRRWSRPIGWGGDGSHLVRWLDNFPDVGINNALYWAACRAEEDGCLDRIEEDLIFKAVELGESETAARRTVESARTHVSMGGVR